MSDDTKIISFRWDIQCNVLYRSEMEVPADLFGDDLILFIEDNIQMNTRHDQMEKIQDWDYDTLTIHEKSTQEVIE